MMPKTTTYRTVAGLNRALRQVPREASKELRNEAQSLAGDIASRAASRARSLGGVAKHVAPTIKAKRDRVPVVQMGGNRRSLPSGGVVGDVWGGAEFGSRKYRQFAPFEPGGRFLYRVVGEMSDDIIERYSEALARALRKVD